MQAHNKPFKLKSYATGNKVWLNSINIKTKYNFKLKKNFHIILSVTFNKQISVWAQTAKKWQIHNFFHMSLLEQNITKKKRIKKIPKLDTSNKNSVRYQMEVI